MDTHIGVGTGTCLWIRNLFEFRRQGRWDKNTKVNMRVNELAIRNREKLWGGGDVRGGHQPVMLSVGKRRR